MAERHRGRDAGLAGIDDAAVFRGEPAQIEDIDLEAVALRSTSRAMSASRNVFDISPGQVCSLRDEPLMMRMRDGDRRVVMLALGALAMASRAASHSTERS